MFAHWKPRFEGLLGLHVVKLTGESSADLISLDQGNIIIATAMHWDALGRRWKQRKHIQEISLYIVDELQLLGGVEGPTMEIVLSRARFVASQLEKRVRVIGLSSSLANAKDVGDWLGTTAHNTFNFAPDVRSVPLDIHILGFESSHFGSRLMAMSRPTFNALATVPAGNKPSVVFVPSRKQAQLSAIDIVTSAATMGTSDRFLMVADKSIPALARFEELVLSVKDSVLRDTLSRGVGFLHTGLSRSDRMIVTESYQQGFLSVLVCPHSMCWTLPGPAYQVIVMDTVYYEGREHKYVDCSITDILQMIGVASRPLLDDSAKAIVLCQASKKEFLKKFLFRWRVI